MNSSQIRVIIQCRTSSTRLPGKAFLPLKQIPAVVLCAKRAMNSGANVVVATSDATSDDNLVELLESTQIPVFRGPLEDVLKRYVKATTTLKETDLIVRLTADNVFPDGKFIQEVVNYAIEHRLPYCTTDNHDLPYGLAAEVFTAAALREADHQASSANEREHVTSWLQKKTPQNIYHPSVKLDMANYRCTLDTLEDYLALEKIFQQVPDPISISWQSLCELLKQAPANKPLAGFTLGTVQLGMPYGVTNQTGMLGDDTALALIRYACQQGIRTYDCARGYGLAEHRVGKALAHQTAVIVTKLSPLMEPDQTPAYYKNAVRASVFESCYELKRPVLDVLLLHRFWQSENPFIWQELLALKQQGVIKALGVSVSSTFEAINVLQNPEFTVMQLPFNIMDWRWHDKEFLTLLNQRKDFFVYARSIFLQGLLTNAPTMWPPQFQALGEKIMAQLVPLSQKFKRKNVKDLCLAYARSQPWIDSLVIGCENLGQLTENISLFEEPLLTPAECRAIEKSLPELLPENFLNPALW